jgi:hypothetical protein
MVFLEYIELLNFVLFEINKIFKDKNYELDLFYTLF